jgi:hypothetical protein
MKGLLAKRILYLSVKKFKGLMDILEDNLQISTRASTMKPTTMIMKILTTSSITSITTLKRSKR